MNLKIIINAAVWSTSLKSHCETGYESGEGRICGTHLKFAYNVFDRRTTARHTQEAASHHVNALYSLPSELLESRGKIKLPKHCREIKLVICGSNILHRNKSCQACTMMGGYLLSTKPLKPYWIPRISFTPYTSNVRTICDMEWSQQHDPIVTLHASLSRDCIKHWNSWSCKVSLSRLLRFKTAMSTQYCLL